MTLEDDKAIVLAKYPTAWVYTPKPNYPIAMRGGNQWTIMKAARCEPSLENSLGMTSLTDERTAWAYAAAFVSGNKPPIDSKPEMKAVVSSGYNHTKYNNYCLLKAGDNEPIFVIRAQDESASGIIQMWLIANPHISPEKRAEALDCQRAMREWPKDKKKKAD